jgi:hypothetical protein
MHLQPSWIEVVVSIIELVLQASPSDSLRWMYCITTTQREGLCSYTCRTNQIAAVT